jgi:ketosteroid isomerase-like protein
MTPVPAALLLALALTSASNLPSQPRPTSAAIDADVWAPISASVVNKDIAAMGRVYHPDAVVVSNNGTQTIRSTLVRWGEGMVADKAKGLRATVEFRFSKRQDDGETAFEVGVFKYTSIDKAGVSTPRYVQLEALLVKRQGKWVFLMERQLDTVTEAVWNSLPH